jgi:hypothetical protein
LTFWHIETNQGLKLIDELRAEIRSGRRRAEHPRQKRRA